MNSPQLENIRFGRLIVIRKLSESRGGSVLWECKCDCGTITKVSTRHLNRKKNVIRSCGCLHKVSGVDHRDWKGHGEISGSWWIQRVMRTHDLRPKIEISITIEDAWDLFLKQDRKCSLTGVDLIISIKPFGTASIDRIDSSKGYVLGNVQWVHKDINYMKRHLTQEYFIDLCTKVAKYNV